MTIALTLPNILLWLIVCAAIAAVCMEALGMTRDVRNIDWRNIRGYARRRNHSSDACAR